MRIAVFILSITLLSMMVPLAAAQPPAADLATRIVSLEALTYAGAPHPLGRYNGTVEVCNIGSAPAVNASFGIHVSATVGSSVLVGWPATFLVGECTLTSVVFDTPGVVGQFTFLAYALAANETATEDNVARQNETKVASVAGAGVILPNGVRPTPGPFDDVLATLGNTLQSGVAVAAVNATERTVCPSSSTSIYCAQIRGDYGTGQVTGCRRSGSGSIPSNVVYTLFHPHEPSAHPILDPLLPAAPDTGLRPCDLPTAMEHAYGAATLIDDTIGA